MKILLILSTFLFLSATTFFSGNLAAMDEETLKKNLSASEIATNAWLALVDQGKYGESWDAGSLTFQGTIKRDEWIKNLEAVRKPLGNLEARNVLDIRYATNPPTLPAGEYMVYFYNTSFANKKQTYELVTLQQQSDGSWKVLTYQIQ